MDHYEDRAIDLHLLSNNPKRFFSTYKGNIEAQIKCRLLNISLIQHTDDTMAQMIKSLKGTLKTYLKKECSPSTHEIVQREFEKLLNNDAFLLKNSIPLLMAKYEADILKLTERYCRAKFITSSDNLRQRVYDALHTELMALRHQKEPLYASIGLTLKATVSPNMLRRLSNEEDIELLQSCDNRLAEKYRPVIHIKTQRMIDGTTTLKEDIQSGATLMLLEKIRKSSLKKNYKNDGMVYPYLNTIIQRDILTVLKQHRSKIDTISVSNSYHPASTDSGISRFEGDDELSYYLHMHAQTLDAALTIVCKNEETARQFKLILAMMYNAEGINPRHIKSLYSDCKRETIDEIIQFAGQEQNRQDFFEFMNGILSRIEHTQTQKSDSFRKNYERKEDKIWDVLFTRHNINFSRRGNQNIAYFTELVRHYFEDYSNKAQATAKYNFK